jgi:hypothetical protein
MMHALKDGLARGFGHPGMVLGLWLVLVLAALPASLIVTDSIKASIGSSLAAETMTQGFDFGWYGEFGDGARGLEKTFAPTLSGAGAILKNLEGWATGSMFKMFFGVVALGMGFAAIWALLIGGVLERLAKPGERFGPSRFLQAGAGLFLRFVRLTLMSGVLYLLIYRLHNFLYGRIDDWTRDVLAERTVLLYCLAVVALTMFLLTLVHVCFAYAKIATVIDQRRSAIFAALRGIGFVIAHPVKTLGLYYAIGLITFALVAAYTATAPGATQSSTLGIAVAFLFGQFYLVLRLFLRVSLLGAQMSLYQGLSGTTAPVASPANAAGFEVAS